MSRPQKSKKLLSPKAGALSVMSPKQSGNPPFVENSRIRTELLAHRNLVNEIPIDKLLKIEKVAIYLEGKGKQPNKLDFFRRHINVLARHAN
jgi:hypothetical protein